jgi:hypothetical protein
MCSQVWKLCKTTSPSVYLKSVAIFLFLTLSVIVVACGGTSSTTMSVDPSNPVVTVTIRLGQVNGSPTPPLPEFICGAWATATSPPFNTSSAVNVFAKFVHNVDGNPVGEGNASATATVSWPDGTTSTEHATTTSDGLAVFPVAIEAVAINKLVLISVTFSKPGTPGCTVPQAAYFTAVIASPTANPSPSPTLGNTPTTIPTAVLTPTLTPIPTFPRPTPTKTPRPTPTPKH